MTVQKANLRSRELFDNSAAALLNRVSALLYGVTDRARLLTGPSTGPCPPGIRRRALVLEHLPGTLVRGRQVVLYCYTTYYTAILL